ncbi:unnamed protein product [Meganyctiphanes norvegica]|uniref:ATP synthase F0 subunit 8 n=1 Tax=Meganyctiphanes norvegica TaxID=48144 RepID=A0AAV2RW00_MEGNR
MRKSYITELSPDELIFVKTNYAIWMVVVLRWFMYIFMSLPVLVTFLRPFFLKTFKPKYLLNQPIFFNKLMQINSLWTLDVKFQVPNCKINLPHDRLKKKS